ncbi:MAG TPA: ABC transporter ATP-binding protein, partial [Myxococcota bacterium]|nr:ABC transporter ATP-binding protein [Myxococcota bacterium]
AEHLQPPEALLDTGELDQRGGIAHKRTQSCVRKKSTTRMPIDAPTTGLDPANQRRIAELIRGLQQKHGITSVVVTHELDLCFSVSDRVALLKQGRIVAQGSAASMQHSDHPDVRAFLSGERDAAGPEP